VIFWCFVVILLFYVIFIFVCTSVGLLPPSESPMAVVVLVAVVVVIVVVVVVKIKTFSTVVVNKLKTIYLITVFMLRPVHYLITSMLIFFAHLLWGCLNTAAKQRTRIDVGYPLRILNLQIRCSQICEKRLLASSLSVSLSGRIKKTPPVTERIFMIFYFFFLENLSRRMTFHENLRSMTGTLHEDICAFMIVSRLILLKMTNVSDKSRENQNTICVQ
jgi:hypothetical protein